MLVTKDAETILITDPVEINTTIMNHYQTAAEGINEPKHLNEQWSRQYSPIPEIDEGWFHSVMVIPSDDEWNQIISSLPNGRAAGLSKVSNEILKHTGSKMSKIIKKLIGICLILNDISQE